MNICCTLKMMFVFVVSAEKCNDLSWVDFSNGKITYNASVVDGKVPLYTVATYTCNFGYSRKGGRTSTCKLRYSTPNWHGRSPTCESKS